MSDYNNDNYYNESQNEQGNSAPPDQENYGRQTPLENRDGWQQGTDQSSYYNMPDYNRSNQGYYGYQQNDPGQQNRPPKKETNSMAITSMLLGIFSLVTCCASPLGIILGIVSIVLAILSKKGQPMSGFAIAGIVLSAIGILLSLLFFAYYMLVLSLMKDPQYATLFNDLLEQYQSFQ